jgi:hypothetical protein
MSVVEWRAAVEGATRASGAVVPLDRGEFDELKRLYPDEGTLHALGERDAKAWR